MSATKLAAGSVFPEIQVTGLDGNSVDLGARKDGWKLVVVYRGKHCPLCTRYLNELQQHAAALADNGIDVTAVSADTREQLLDHSDKLEIDFPIYYGLSIEQMQLLGLYISRPRSAQETDHPFAEPGLFVINHDGLLQLVDISNGPFSRPELATLVGGIGWIKDPHNHYPIRGTYPQG